ncbi:MAG: RagB/SusD family nutrient uptake outer membrane protein [Tannerella sp.]|nr:RagB/SusD family nutrient uptake outer membrane protein [Tannerella sp.]
MKRINIKLNRLFILGIAVLLTSCDYLDIVPENVRTVDDMFVDRYAAEQSLASCYWALPRTNNNWNRNPAIFGSMEAIINRERRTDAGMRLALGDNNATSPVMNYWNDKGDGTRSVYAGIRECNTFLDNIEGVKDLPRLEKDRMIAEAKMLKALMHFQLICFYGPVCPMRTSPPVDESTVGVKVYREKIDDCFQYVLDLIDEAIESNALPSVIANTASELGRFTQAAAYAVKAKALVYRASPLFNGNTDYNDFLDHNGEHFFNQTYNPDLWTQAAEACKQAVAHCEENGRHRLYEDADFVPSNPLSPEYHRILTLRNSVSDLYTKETVWATGRLSEKGYQTECIPRFEGYTTGPPTPGRWSVPLQTVELFYSSNGVPIEEDKDWLNGEDKKYDNRFNPRMSDEAHKQYVQLGEQSASMNFDRELRFYSSLGFDRGKWYGNHYNNTPDDDSECLFPRARAGETASFTNSTDGYNATGYWPKKLVRFGSNYIDQNSFFSIQFILPDIRYADLLLLTAEALNESKTQPDIEVYQYIDRVRERAGLEGVVESWSKYTENASKPTTKDGMRSIIQRERKIELALEGQYHWDCRRWKTAPAELNRLIQGWTVTESDVAAYYQPFTVYTQKFSLRDYFMPIPESDIINNPQLIQNPGW